MFKMHNGVTRGRWEHEKPTEWSQVDRVDAAALCGGQREWPQKRALRDAVSRGVGDGDGQIDALDSIVRSQGTRGGVAAGVQMMSRVERNFKTAL
jgi:hypothetical protein